MISRNFRIALGGVLLLAGAASADDFVIDWWTVDGGGPGAPGWTTGGDFELGGTIGQPDAQTSPVMTGGGFELVGGFWAVPPCWCISDVNHDGVRDVVAVDMGKAALEVLTTLPDGGLVNALRFQVFQGRRFTDQPDTHGEPREVLAGDVTGDGIDDMVLIVHDRVIVYPGQ